jgi:hypothetical protein
MREVKKWILRYFYYYRWCCFFSHHAMKESSAGQFAKKGMVSCIANTYFQRCLTSLAIAYVVLTLEYERRLKMDLKKLKDSFPEKDIEWRLQSSGIKKSNEPWGLCVAYITARAIQDRLDEVCGPENWQNMFTTGPDGGLLCGIGIRVGNDWIWKWDGAENTKIEPVKGGLSDATKRAAVQWGIGRYLYELEVTWANFGVGTRKAKINDQYFKWSPPSLPSWAVGRGATPQPVSSQESAPRRSASKMVKVPPAEDLYLDHDSLAVVYPPPGEQQPLVEKPFKSNPTIVKIFTYFGGYLISRDHLEQYLGRKNGVSRIPANMWTEDNMKMLKQVKSYVEGSDEHLRQSVMEKTIGVNNES